MQPEQQGGGGGGPHSASGGPDAPSKMGETEKGATGRLQTSRQSFIPYPYVRVLSL